MKHLIYISGPPCSGKTTVCENLLKFTPQPTYIIGDRFWLENEVLPFDKRVSAANQCILEAIQRNKAPHLLLEWVPSQGGFCDEIRRICDIEKRSFSHIVLFATASALKERKMSRDGDSDIGNLNIESIQSIDDALVIDTTGSSKEKVVGRCIESLISSKVLQQDG